jgi:predicted permease
MRWYQRFFRRGLTEKHLDAELRFHLEQQIADYVAAGMKPEEARRRARLEFGGIDQLKEACRDVGAARFLETLVQDVRYGLRQLRCDRGFTVIAVLTLALGIGANVAIFSLVDQTILRPLPVQHPEQLVVVNSTEQKGGHTSTDYSLAATFSYPMYKDLRDKNRVFSGLIASFSLVDVNVTWQGKPERSEAELVSGNFFQVLGVQAALGRLFAPADETARGANPVVVLSHGYWLRHFGGNAAILNQVVDINATPLTVVGVTQPGFTGVQLGWAPDLYIPITMKPQMTPNWDGLDSPTDHFLAILGRLETGMSRPRAEAGLQPLFHGLLEGELPVMTARQVIVSQDARKAFLAGRIELVPGARGRPVLQSFAQPLLAFVMAMVGIVLLIACANLAGLLLARGEARQHEIALRLAIGASRVRLVRQLLTESLIVAVAGGVASLLVGWWTLRSIVSAISVVPVAASVLSGLTAKLDWRVLSFAAAATILSALFFGLLPALKSSRSDLETPLKEQGPGTSGGTGSVRLRGVLVAAQVACSAFLLIVAVLFGETLVRLGRANLGMRIDHLVQFSMDPGLSHYSSAQAFTLLQRVREDIAALPGVASVGSAQDQVLSLGNNCDTMTFEGYAPHDDTTVSVNYVGPRFFATMGVPLILGREFREEDSASSRKVAIINEKVAQQFFAARNPIGMHLAIGWGPDAHPNIEIIGVVLNTRSSHPREPPQPFVYFPFAQNPDVSGATFYVRTSSDPGAMASALRQVTERDAPNLPVYDVRTVEEQFSNLMAADRLLTYLTLGMALLAALLAAVGLYGVMAYVVIRRRRETAIRMALGAQRADVLKQVMGNGLRLALIGLAIGIASALALSRLLSSMLYGVKPTEAAVYIAVTSILLTVAFAACYIPARRALKVDPMVALRHE